MAPTPTQTPTLLALDLRGRAVVAVGGGPVTARRVRDLLADGAVVTVVAPELVEELVELAARGAVGWLRRAYAGPDDLAGAWLVHTAAGDPEVDRRVATDAEARHTFCVNAGEAAAGTAQVPARGTVELPDGTLRVAVHAGGDPRRAATVRTSVVNHLDSGVVDLRAHRPRDGWVALVGAGPGHEGLLTRRAGRLLAAAHVVVTDRLVPEALLDALPEDVLVIDVGKTPGHHPVPQDRINELIVEHALAGRGVVRLKGGDPYVLGRGGEERLACEAAGVPVEVVPGITSAVSVPAAAGIPVTHRGVARGFTVVTGHEQVADLPPGSDHTVVLLMGIATLRDTAARLVAQGRPGSCPVAVVERGWTVDQRVTLGTLADVADRADEVGVRSPAVVVVGDVVRLAHAAGPWRTGAAEAGTHTAGTDPAGTARHVLRADADPTGAVA